MKQHYTNAIRKENVRPDSELVDKLGEEAVTMGSSALTLLTQRESTTFCPAGTKDAGTSS